MRLTLRPAADADREAIWSILRPVIRAGETYALPRDMTEDDALGYWLAPDKQTFVAADGAEVLGTYYLRSNQQGGGSHVANCGYMTASHATGRGIARAMCEHSLRVARECGFAAMQFNFVVSTNLRAVSLWQSMGFEIVGRLPRAFRRPSGDEVDALVMFKVL